MRILTFDELTPEMERSRALVNIAAFGSIYSHARIDTLRRMKLLSEYVGVFAVERQRVLGHVFVELIPYDFPEGPGVVAGIATVGTRPDMGRSGIASALLREAHRREREAGRRYAALWTNRSWGAHGLYQKLGYRDVYSSPWALHLPTERRPRAPEVGPARRSDLDDIDRLHNRMARGRWGYCRRVVGSTRAAVRHRYLDPAKELLVTRRGKRLTGYAYLDRSPRRLICGELVAISRGVTRQLIEGVGRAAGPLPYAFQHTPVTDNPELFREPGYVTGPVSWYGMMALDLAREWNTRSAEAAFGTRDPRFLCLAGDRF
jgi:predicted N-acetyltransferase YhbS